MIADDMGDVTGLAGRKLQPAADGLSNLCAGFFMTVEMDVSVVSGSGLRFSDIVKKHRKL